MKRKHAKPNPVGKMVTEHMRLLLDKIDIATSKTRSRVFLDADWNEGYAWGDGSQPIGPAPTTECTAIKVGIAFRGELDATRPLIPQLVAWLEKCADDVARARQGVAMVKEDRNIRALRVLVAETEVIA